MPTANSIDVNDRPSFKRFLELLHQDYQQNKDKWENKTLDNFLQAMIAYSEDIQGYYDNTNQPVNADHASWKIFADILRGATMYE